MQDFLTEWKPKVLAVKKKRIISQVIMCHINVNVCHVYVLLNGSDLDRNQSLQELSAFFCGFCCQSLKILLNFI